LRKKGFRTDDELGQEDFGWYLSYDVDGESYCIVGGYRDDDLDDNAPHAWILWIEKNVGFFKSIAGQRDKDINEKAIVAVQECLKSNPRIENVLWHEKKNFEQGKEELGTPDP
jgi:hypothetical protein